MYVLVYESVLRDDDQFQLAHACWFVPVPGLWRRANSDANADTDTESGTDANAESESGAYSNAGTVAHANTHTDTTARAERAE